MSFKFNRGMSPMRIMIGLTSLFFLTIMFVYFDPVVEDTIYAWGDEELADDSKPQNVIDKYLNAWHFWVPAFLLAIFIYVVSAGAERPGAQSI